MGESYSVNAVISAVDSNFSSTFRAAAKSVSSFQAGTQTGLGRVGATVSKVGGTLTKGITVPLGLMAVAAAKTSMDFNAQMSRVQAISGATGKQMGAMKKQAIDLGAKTAFSAKQAAEGMENLASAGMNSTQIMKAMPGVLNLAAVSGGDVAKAAENMSTALNAFGLSAGKSSHVADVFAKAAAKTNAEASDMGEALKYVAPQAHAAGLSLEETSAAIGLLSDNGLKGSTAGTTLAQALMRVQKPSAEAQKAMSKLGFSAYDSSGKMKPLAKQVSELKGKMKGMTDEQKANTLATIYGMEGGRAMNVLLGEQDGKLAALTKSLKNSKGSAADMAKIMQDNAKSAVEQLGGAFESAAIVIGDKMAPTIKSVANTIAALVGKFNDASPAVQNFVLALLGIAAAVGPIMMLAGKIMTLTSEFATLAQAAGGLKPLMSGVGNVMTKVFAGAAVLGGIMLMIKGFQDLYKTSSTFRTIVDALGNVLKGVLAPVFAAVSAAISVVSNAFSSLNKATGGVIGPIIQIVAGFALLLGGLKGLGVLSTIGSLFGSFGGILAGLLSPIGLVVAALAVLAGAWAATGQLNMNGLQQAITNIITFITTSIPKFAQMGMQLLSSLASGISAALPQIMAAIAQVMPTVMNTILTGLPQIITAGVSIITSLLAGFTQMLPGLIASAVTIITTLVTGIAQALPQLIAAGVQVLTVLIGGIIAMLPMLINAGLQIITALGQAIIANLPALLTAALQLVVALANGIIQNLPQLLNAAVEIIMALVNGLLENLPQIVSTAIKMIVVMAGAIISMVPEIISAGVKLTIALVKALIQAIPQLLNAGVQLIEALVRGVISILGALISAGVRLVTGLFTAIVNFVGRMLSAGKQLVTSVISGIASGIGKAASTAKQVATGAWQAVKGFGSRMLSAGKDFVMGFVNGIKGAIGAAASAAASMAKSAVSAAKSFLHIKSPSRIMRNEVGKYVALGMAVGIQKNTGAVIDASEAMAKAAVIDTDQFQLTDTFGSVNSNLNNGTLAGAMEHELNVANNWTVEVPVNLDGQEVARITAKPMQQELNRMDTQNNRIHGQR